MSNQEHSPPGGFTLIELLLCLALAGIVGAVAIPRMSHNTIVGYTIKTNAHQLVADLRLTRFLAVSQNATYILNIDAQNLNYRIYKGSIAPANQASEAHRLSAGTIVTGESIFTFQPGGNLAGGSGTTTTLSSGGNQWQITVVPATGRSSMMKL